MEIQFFGHSCFRIKGKQVILITDPFDLQSVGLKFPQIFADIITVSRQHSDHNNVSAVSGTSRRPEPFVVTGPGEYEISGVSIFGIPSGKNTIYIIDVDDLRLVHLGDLGHKLTETQLEEINGVDVLFVPVGGGDALDSQKAVEVVTQVEPKIVIPMHSPIEDFLKLIGAEETKPVQKLVISKEKLPEERQVVVLDARN